jgi:hypothetical protein
VSSKRRKTEVVDPDFTLFDNPQKGYSVFEGLDIAQVAKAIHPNEVDTLEVLPPPEQGDALPANTPPPLPDAHVAKTTLKAKPSFPEKTPTQKPTFVFRQDWELLLPTQQLKVLEYLVSLNSPQVWIQASTIERESGVPLPTVKRSLSIFRTKKFIKSLKRRFSGGQQHSVINLDIDFCQKVIKANKFKIQ